ncbi:hypothetical protein FE634_04115 [Nocardioides dongxiaopingii]|uniref:Pr6Pr family membrane protein n=1 Tax=Nocardioides sp. S-1144 TaxID=2582905 RepID=UPI00110E23FE|nr:Pr6Pr family membrane protein [Nocardioides sp. S-1144]QCW49797.1 hypothetical protein FE634_04115 [Nocardioides sp. S-1144]
MGAARRWHVATAALAVGGLTLQLVLVIIGNPVLAEVEPPGLGLRLYRFAAYFTVESNALVAYAALTLARDPLRDGPRWRVVRLAGIVAITVTALVHFLLLRPLLDLEGWDYVADKVLHMAVPAVAILGWLRYGPRPRVSSATIWSALALLLGWTAWTLAFGQLDGWYPYPFLDPDEEGWPGVVVVLVGVLALVTALSLAARWWDRRPARQ